MKLISDPCDGLSPLPKTYKLSPHGAFHNGMHNGQAIASGDSSTSPFVINITWDASVNSAPAEFKPAVLKVVDFIRSNFVDPITLNLNVGYGVENGNVLGSGTLGQSQYYLYSLTYSQLYTAMQRDLKSNVDTGAFPSLPSTSPVSGGNFWLSQCQAKALGLFPANNTGIDGWVGFSSIYPFTYDNTNGVAGGTYDFFGTCFHEITEVMGRFRVAGASLGGLSPSYSLLDLFVYSQAGLKTYQNGGYFSADNGTTVLGTFNTSNSGDVGDWSSSVANDCCDAFSSSGIVNVVTTADLMLLDVIGYDPTGSVAPPPPPPGPPTDVRITPMTTYLQSLINSSRPGTLAPHVAILNVQQVGGNSASTFTYTLGGSDAASFVLSGTTISTTGTPLPGAQNGYCYRINVTATDNSTGMNSPTVPFNIIVGSSTADVINVGILSTRTDTRTVVYALAGNDTIDASAMTGSVWLVGCSGADNLIGGNVNSPNHNTFLYSNTSESGLTSFDTLSNFNATKDVINVAALNGLRYAGQIVNSIPGKSIGWYITGGFTFVVANTGNKTISPTLANLKIQLIGAMSLTTNNFAR